jgi:hypothetical protein
VETAFVNEIVHIFVEKAMVRIIYELYNDETCANQCDETKLKRVETAFVNEIVHIFVEKTMVRIIYELYNVVLGVCVNDTNWENRYKRVTLAMQFADTCVFHRQEPAYKTCEGGHPMKKHPFYFCCNRQDPCSDCDGDEQGPGCIAANHTPDLELYKIFLEQDLI